MDNLEPEEQLLSAERKPSAPAAQMTARLDAPNVLQLLDRAIASQRQGNLTEAEQFCIEILKTQPAHFDAIHLLGVIYHALGRLDDAVGSYSRALDIRPGDAIALNNRGVALCQLKRFDEALKNYDRSLAIRSEYVEALCNRGTALLELQRYEAAVGSYDKALALKPDDAVTLLRRGTAFLYLKRLHEALGSYDRALAIKPDYVEVLDIRGVVLTQLGRLTEALASYDRALAFRSGDARVHNNRGLILHDLGRFEESLASYDRALALRPDYPAALANRGVTLAALRRPEEALASYDKAIALKPDYAEALNNRGNALRDSGQLDDALASYERALTVRGDYPDALNNRGIALLDLTRFAEALASYDRAVQLDPEHADHRFNRSLLLLLLGRFDAGWQEYQWRRKKKAWVEIKSSMSEWRGEDISGKRIILHSEQGLGDTVQFARFAENIVAMGAKVTVAAPARLVGLLQRLNGNIPIVQHGEEVPEFDLHLPLMSVPFVLGLRLEAIPREVPYLSADPIQVDLWSTRLPPARLRVGIAWQGKPTAPIDKGRSIPLKVFAPLSQIPGVKLISLQKEAGLEQLADLAPGMKVETLGPDFDVGPDAFLDTAAVMMNLDLVITSDSAVAHVAGALGRPVWIMLKRVPDWRWMLDREDSPWYPTARLFRQKRAGDWDEVFSRVADELARLAADSPTRSETGTVAVPASFGELIDKITILRIKKERIADAIKLANIQRELGLLTEVQRRSACRVNGISALEGELEEVNGELWNIEDRIRDCERQADFGPEFIGLARAVYQKNDRRAALKRQINEITGSALIEEKSYL